MPRGLQVDEKLAALAADPQDESLREAAALALTHSDRHGEAHALLTDGRINLTAHDGPTLPCLCRRCGRPSEAKAEAEGIEFARRFVLASGRVLFYWVPTTMADDAGLRREIRARLQRRRGRG